MRTPDAFLESIRMYNRLSDKCRLYCELIEKQDVVIRLLKKKKLTASESVRYSNACDRILKIKETLYDPQV